MATIDKSKPIQVPPAHFKWADSTGNADSPETRAFVRAKARAINDLADVMCAKQFTPVRLHELSYEDEPIRALRGYQHRINRSEVQAYDSRLLTAVEKAWDGLKERIRTNLMPVVQPGDAVISFCWFAPSKRLEVGFYIDDDTDQVVCDWVLDIPSAKVFGEPETFCPETASTESIAQQVRKFARA